MDTRSLIRFFTRIHKDVETGCWNWPHTAANGYGLGQIDGKFVLVHRASYLHFNGPLYMGEVVRHTCHNKACANPKHLIKGSQKENVADSVKAGRRADALKKRWTTCKTSKRFTDAEIATIRKRLANGESGYKLASVYGTSEAYLSLIRRQLARKTKQPKQPKKPSSTVTFSVLQKTA